ncbi:MAG: hypothetical protein ABF856_07705 [Acetobacter aceti]|nr:hypothetical protein [Acetobacter aceti]
MTARNDVAVFRVGLRQRAINDELIRRAKGGAPFIFGRGGETPRGVTAS